ncbi:hypothetical protein MY04_2195 [Flammeovirga sp. MY04]|uniref:hypothetical protein n=1 Tax=Flammeovirga sp. MY04 TaxID=1191459 RepID=UPI0008063CF3|nr:hypothetical protein [Flammeovirga sp. MY04]ANQ49569.1 hypothetical protein MY04_2195 [Flammeovirga sp. MY04]
MKSKNIILLFIGLFFSTFLVAQNVKQNKSAHWGNRHVKSSSKGGKPTNAIGYLSEGNLAAFAKEDQLFKESLTPELEQLGITASDWNKAQDKLRDQWRLMNSKSFKKAIKELNQDIFSKHNCIAVYAEYGGKGGQKAMTIYDKKTWESLPE